MEKIYGARKKEIEREKRLEKVFKKDLHKEKKKGRDRKTNTEKEVGVKQKIKSEKNT